VFLEHVTSGQTIFDLLCNIFYSFLKSYRGRETIILIQYQHLTLRSIYPSAHQRGARGNHGNLKDHVGRPPACSKNNINMVSAIM